MAEGIQNLAELHPDVCTSTFVDNFLDQFLLNRIGSNVLLNQYLASIDKSLRYCLLFICFFTAHMFLVGRQAAGAYLKFKTILIWCRFLSSHFARSSMTKEQEKSWDGWSWMRCHWNLQGDGRRSATDLPILPDASPQYRSRNSRRDHWRSCGFEVCFYPRDNQLHCSGDFEE